MGLFFEAMAASSFTSFHYGAEDVMTKDTETFMAVV
jgi:hypothetical protein